MNKYPEYIEVNNIKYKINTDFRIALKCDEIFRDEQIGNYEKTLAIIYLLLGSEALKDYDHHEQITKLIIKYLLCGKIPSETNSSKEPSMNFKQDIGYIKASFMSDYKIDIDKIEMHWWQFNDLLVGLTENSILNRVRTIREEPLNGKKGRELQKWQEAKKQVELTKEKTSKEKELDEFWKNQTKKEWYKRMVI